MASSTFADQNRISSAQIDRRWGNCSTATFRARRYRCCASKPCLWRDRVWVTCENSSRAESPRCRALLWGFSDNIRWEWAHRVGECRCKRQWSEPCFHDWCRAFAWFPRAELSWFRSEQRKTRLKICWKENSGHSPLTFFLEIFLIATLSPLKTPTVVVTWDGSKFSLIIEPRPELTPNWVIEKFCREIDVKNTHLSCNRILFLSFSILTNLIIEFLQSRLRSKQLSNFNQDFLRFDSPRHVIDTVHIDLSACREMKKRSKKSRIMELPHHISLHLSAHTERVGS